MTKGLWAVVVLLVVYSSPALAAGPFRFEAETSLSDMQGWVRAHLQVGSARESVRATFVDQGGATLKVHPTQTGVEKYIYDINLCSYYIWRWNISADYDPSGGLKQVYVNGEPALAGGPPPRSLPSGPPDQKAAIFKIARPRPEAFKGESSLAAVILDRDANLQTIDDEDLIGGGPTRSDPSNMGTLHTYHVEPWRSIFDMDDAKVIVPYSGDCTAADAAMARSKPH